MTDNYGNLNRYKKEIQKIHEQNVGNKAKQILSQQIHTRITTAFIFAIAEMERLFGDLWAHNEEDDNKLSEQHLFYDKLYENFRKRVLDNGNYQIRELKKDLNNYYIKFDKFKFNVKQDDNNE
jgi:hypothetical protein